jgi:hypothetical protein
MIISHDLNGNGYFINNEIWLTISSDSPTTYFRTTFSNLANSKISTQFISYADASNKALINIQSVIKSLMDVPNGETNNSTKIQISITSNDNTNITFIKDFIRGGKRVNDTNQTISPNQTLRLSEKLPVWLGFPVFDYYLSPTYVIQKQTLADVTNIDYRRIKGCNNIYLKFLNQKGGYSYWVFESYTAKETGQNLGYVTGSTNNIIDLGNENKSSLEVYSKIPKEYRDYALDFVCSPDIYAYQNGNWKKIFTNNNSVEYDNIKKVYSVNFQIGLYHRFNPSLLWSN